MHVASLSACAGSPLETHRRLDRYDIIPSLTHDSKRKTTRDVTLAGRGAGGRRAVGARH